MTVNRKFEWLKAIMVAPLADKAKLIAVQIFNYSDAKGMGAHPGYNRLASDLGFSTVTIKRYLKELRDTGWIVKTRSSNATGTRKFADTYAISLPTIVGHLDDPRSKTTEGHLGPTEGHLPPDRGSSGRPTNTSFPSNPQHHDADTPWGEDGEWDPWDSPRVIGNDERTKQWTSTFGGVPE